MGNKQRVFEFLKSYIDENGYPPNYREIGDALEMHLSTVSYWLDKLEIEGTIERKPKSARAIRIVG